MLLDPCPGPAASRHCLPFYAEETNWKGMLNLRVQL